MADNRSRDQVLAELDAVLRGFVGKRQISEENRILQDFGINGDDADEFLKTVHKRFGTCFDGFDFSTYFSNDEIGSGEVWLRRLGFEDPRKPLTNGHLVDVIMRGAWFDPPGQPATSARDSRLRRYLVRGLIAALFPVFFSLMALALGGWMGNQVGLARGIGMVLFGLPVAVLLTAMMWRKLPAN